MADQAEPESEATPSPPLFAIVGEATPEEIAALVAVLQAAAASGVETGGPSPGPEWCAPHRTMRRHLLNGPGGWRSSGLPSS